MVVPYRRHQQKGTTSVPILLLSLEELRQYRIVVIIVRITHTLRTPIHTYVFL